MSRVLFIHDEMLDPGHALFAQYPDLPRIFVFDTVQIERDQFSLRRLQFIADCVAELPGVQVYRGMTSAVLQELGVTEVVTQRTPQLHIGAALSAFVVEWHDEPQFVEFRGRLKRFMHYWRAVEMRLLGQGGDEETPEARPPRDPKLRQQQMRVLARDGVEANPPASTAPLSALPAETGLGEDQTV